MSENLKRWQCHKCEKSFTDYGNLSRHKSAIHNTTNPNQHLCPICSKSYASKKGLTVHVKNIHNETENRFQSTTCSYGTMVKTFLEGHLRTNTGEKPFKCDDCEKAFAHRKGLRMHIVFVHSEYRPFQCVECASTFKKKSDLSIHHKRCHIPDPVSRTEECKFCGKCFKSAHDMRNHLMRMHSGEKLFACPVDGCTRMFYMRYELTKHTRQKHSDERPFRCAICLKAFKLKYVYEAHHSLVHVAHPEIRPFECTKCDVKLKTRTNLDMHIRWKHVADNVTRTKECPLCGKCFKTTTALRMHTNRIHLRHKPWSCSVSDCEQTFCTNVELMGHKRNRHSDIRRYKCAVCLAAFKRRGDFNTHYATVHAKG